MMELDTQDAIITHVLILGGCKDTKICHFSWFGDGHLGMKLGFAILATGKTSTM